MLNNGKNLLLGLCTRRHPGLGPLQNVQQSWHLKKGFENSLKTKSKCINTVPQTNLLTNSVEFGISLSFSNYKNVLAKGIKNILNIFSWVSSKAFGSKPQTVLTIAFFDIFIENSVCANKKYRKRFLRYVGLEQSCKIVKQEKEERRVSSSFSSVEEFSFSV